MERKWELENRKEEEWKDEGGRHGRYRRCAGQSGGSSFDTRDRRFWREYGTDRSDAEPFGGTEGEWFRTGIVLAIEGSDVSLALQ